MTRPTVLSPVGQEVADAGLGLDRQRGEIGAQR